MNRERLELQKEVLLDVIAQKKHFSMSSWVDILSLVSDITPEELRPRQALMDTRGSFLLAVGCGTASCAYGWLCRDPRAKELGLSLDNSGRPLYFFPSAARHGQDFVRDSGQVFFDITTRAAHFLFLPQHYRGYCEDITPQDVIERIDWLLAGKAPTDFPGYI